MKGVNKAIIVGSLGQDPEIRYTSDGKACATLSIATSEQWKDKVTGEKKELAEWHKISAFGRLAEIIGEYLTKGSKVYVEGKLKTRKWQDKQGVDRYTTEIIISELQMLDRKNENSAPRTANQASQDIQKPDNSQFDEEFNDPIPF